MREFSEFYIDDTEKFRHKFISWVNGFTEVCLLYSNDYQNRLAGQGSHYSYDLIAGAGSINKISPKQTTDFESLESFVGKSRDWIFGHLGYDLKNSIEALRSEHPDRIKFPLYNFFVPEFVFIMTGNTFKIGWHRHLSGTNSIANLVQEIKNHPIPVTGRINAGNIRGVISKSSYLRAVDKIKHHIQKGDIYEVNFCQEFYSDRAKIDPVVTWLQLIKESPTPFSCYYRLNNKYLLCASPERFIRKTGSKIISQPIKGTSARGKTPREDREAMKLLAGDPKERAENIMITDLVRNDLSRIACRGSVRVDELCGIYPFPRVFQMQSDVSADIRPGTGFTDIIKATFPMGSMTGAPKIKAMEIIEQYEKSKRGLYSGAVGYISPEMDFDFNVVIRSIQYNQKTSGLSFMVGGAITGQSIPENEYRECLLKAEAIMKVLGYNPVPAP